MDHTLKFGWLRHPPVAFNEVWAYTYTSFSWWVLCEETENKSLSMISLRESMIQSFIFTAEQIQAFWKSFESRLRPILTVIKALHQTYTAMQSDGAYTVWYTALLNFSSHMIIYSSGYLEKRHKQWCILYSGKVWRFIFSDDDMIYMVCLMLSVILL